MPTAKVLRRIQSGAYGPIVKVEIDSVGRFRRCSAGREALHAIVIAYFADHLPNQVRFVRFDS